ncbi:MAG: ABC transporter ATP-binding protein [Ruminococcaceae bacterium]|nr:ABC transporter ATP-binding protein [Oscillospiraceae bacterium]
MSHKEKSVKVNTGATLRRVLRCLKPHMAGVVASIVLSAAIVAASLYVPVLIGQAIDLIIAPGRVDFAGVGKLLLRGAVIIAGAALIQWLSGVLNNRIACLVVRDLRTAAFERLQILPLSYIDSHRHGDTISRVITDAEQFSDGLLLGFTQLFTGVVTILGTLVFMITISPVIAGAVVVLTPLSFVVARYIATHIHDKFQVQSETRAEQTAFVDEMLGGLKTVKAFSREDANMERFDEINERLEKCSLSAIFYSSLTNPCTRFVNALVYAVVALLGAFMCIGTAPALTVGMLSTLLAYANQYTKPFNEISGVITELQNAMVCAARVFELIDETPQPAEPQDAVVLDDASGSVTVSDVSFSYVPTHRLIEHFSMEAKPGQRIAIVGPTGCGKTTLINLLMRFYDVTGGHIAVDGNDIRNVTRDSLRSSYGMVLQDTWLASGTIRDNIAMGRPEATEEEIIAAAKSAYAHRFIMQLPEGYDTVLEGTADILSQGQKQLLCIARIMLCHPPMLILDEATSSIDTRTEQRIQAAFDEMMKGRTSFVVAHRLSTIRSADVILAMKDGAVVEQGTHSELLARGGFYATLYNSQFES